MSTRAEASDSLFFLLDALELVLDPDAFVAMRTGAESEEQTAAIRTIDAAIKASPGLSKPITLYKGYEGFPKLRDGGELAEKAYFVGSTVSPKEGSHVPVALTVPAGTPALRLNEETYVLDRSLTLSLKSSKTDLVPATMVTGSTAPGIRLTGAWGTVLPVDGADGGWGTVLIEEFFNPFHAKDGRFGSGKGGGGGAKDPLAAGTKTPEQQARRDKVVKIMAGVAAAVIVVGAVGLILSGGKPPQPRTGEQAGHKGDEKTKSLEKDLQAKLDSKEKHRGEAEKWVDGHKAKGKAKDDLEAKAKAKSKELTDKAKADADAKLKADADAKIKAKADDDAKMKADNDAILQRRADAKRAEDDKKFAPVSKKAEDVLSKAEDATNDMTEAEFVGVDRYISRHYGEINATCRGVPVPDGKGGFKEADPRTPEWIAGLDSAFASGKTASTEGITVFRGVDMDWPEDVKVGDVYVDKGFLSTSINERQVTNFLTGGGYSSGEPVSTSKGVLMTIVTKQDTQMLGTAEGHQELLGNRGTPLKINSIEHCPDGICRINAEIV